jgi:hypothetical protein
MSIANDVKVKFTVSYMKDRTGYYGFSMEFPLGSDNEAYGFGIRY